MLTMLLGGLWHGAAWNFVLWGAYHGTLLVAERKLNPERLKPVTFSAKAISIVIMFQFTLVGWALFRVDSLADLTELAGAFTHFESSKRASWWLVRLIALALPVAIMHAVQVRRGDLEPAKTTSNWARFALATVLACATLTFYQRQGTDFIYFQF